MREIPEVRQFGEHGDDIADLGIAETSGLGHQLVQQNTHGNRATVADRILGVVDQLLQQTRAVLQRAAIFVTALVEAAREEVLYDAEAMRAKVVESVKR